MGIEVFKKHLREKRAVKIIAGIDNYNLENVASVCRAAQKGHASAVDIACDKKVYDTARKNTKLPIFVSSIHPFELLQAAQWGADAIEIGNFDALYKKGMRMSALEILDIVTETLKLIGKSKVFICVTVPGHIEIGEQIALAKSLEEMNIDLIQTEGAATVEAKSNGARGLLETAQVSIANTIELARNVEIPVMTASGLTPTTVALAFAAGASAVGVGSCVNKLNSLLEMTAAASAIVSSANRNEVKEEIEVIA